MTINNTRTETVLDHLPVGPYNIRVKNCNDAFPRSGLQEAGYFVGDVIHDGVGEGGVPLAGLLLLEDILL